MQTTNNLGLKKPGAEDVVNIEDLNSNSDALDGKFGASSGHGHTGVAGDGPKIGSGGLAAGAATDTVIGSRTVSDTTAPTGDSGTPTTLFGWLANMIKAITGGATWRTLPGMTIAAIKTILDAATNAGTASSLMKRDSSGRAQVAAPSAAADIARKDTVDAVQSSLNTHAALGGTAHGATAAPTVSTLMARDSAGRAQVVAPSVAADIANKGYVDSAVSGATIPDASLTVKGKVQLSSATNSTSEVLAATPKAVKDSYDRGSAGVTAAAAAQSAANAAQTRVNDALEMLAGKDAGGDLNNAIKVGVYSWGPGTANRPENVNGYGICITKVNGGDTYNGVDNWCFQTAYQTGYGAMWIRRKINADTWTSWVKVWTAENDGTGSGLDADTVDGVHLSNIQTPKVTGDDGSAISLSSGFDVNNLKTTGFYRGDATNNRPPVSPGNPAAWFFYQVITHDPSWITQVAYEYGTTMIYNRTCSGGIWGEWKAVGAGSILVGSNNIRHTFPNAYEVSMYGRDSDDNIQKAARLVLMGKVLPKGTGEVLISFDYDWSRANPASDYSRSINIKLYGVSFSSGLHSGIQLGGGSLDYRTPVGTDIGGVENSSVILASYNTWTSGFTSPQVISGTLYARAVITFPLPLYLAVLFEVGGSSVTVKNLRISYDVVNV